MERKKRETEKKTRSRKLKLKMEKGRRNIMIEILTLMPIIPLPSLMKQRKVRSPISPQMSPLS
jgi:hypothetical protein